MHRKDRIKYAATVLCLALTGFMLFWAYRLISWLLPYLDADHFQRNRWVENHIEVTLGQQMAFIGIYIPVLVLGIATSIQGIRILLRMRLGDFFDAKTGQSILWLGCMLCACILADVFLDGMYENILTWNNTGEAGQIIRQNGKAVLSLPVEPTGFRYQFPNSHMTIFLCGAAFAIFGWLWSEAALLQQENKEFI